MDMSSPPPCPNTATNRRNPHRKARATPLNAPQICNSLISKLREVPSFPNEETLSAQTLENAPLQPSSTSLGKKQRENIKVFLRIRPLSSSKSSRKVGSVTDDNPRLRAKNAWPQNPTKKNVVGREKNAKKKSSGVCVIVNDSQSVTLSTPKDSQESKKIKSENYGGFSYVFSPDSSQLEVYEKMVKPMMDDFLSGKSGMLAALGPSGSGKTHTVFGCPREPGMVPLALKHIFKESEPRANQALRSFYISIFEIYSERGKAEKLFDLLPDGCELSMQQSTVKGLQEVLISNVGQAESIIAQAVIKRATAMTNSNSQSSRSQCIINIRQKCEGAVSALSNSAVLTIIDLAGAEREKKTGNQGARLLESNFINNTLMVFGLCLRSLLEHQKNPRKPLQKHFQNSLLTRYLREYLEGKKRMTLILTAKSGEEDYLDTSHLLRQAAPYMKIKYNEVEQTNIVPNKRQFHGSFAMEHAKQSSTLVQAKRMRLSSEDSMRNEGESVEELHISKEEASRVCKLDANSCVPLNSESDGLARSDRSHIIMQNFAKAIWNVLKQCNTKLKVAEMEIQSLRESIGYERKKYLELETEMNEFKASCTCCKGAKVKADFECQLKLDAHESSHVSETSLNLLSSNLKASESTSNSANQSCDSAQMSSCEIVFQEKAENRDVDPDSNQINCVDNRLKTDTSVIGCDDDINASGLSGEKLIQQNCQIAESFQANAHCTKDVIKSKHGQTNDANVHCTKDVIKSKHDQTNDDYINCNTDFLVNPTQSCTIMGDDNCLSGEIDQPNSSKEEETFDAHASSGSRLNHSDDKPALGTSCTLLDAENSNRKGWDCSSTPGNGNALEVEIKGKMLTEFNNSSSLPNDEKLEPSSPKDVSSTKACDHMGNRHHETRSISRHPQRPKRRLMPSSSILLRDLSNLDLGDETEISQGSRATRKSAADNLKRTNGSISLIRMLKSNLHL